MVGPDLGLKEACKQTSCDVNTAPLVLASFFFLLFFPLSD